MVQHSFWCRWKQELEELRNECTLLLRERFQLEQCIRCSWSFTCHSSTSLTISAHLMSPKLIFPVVKFGPQCMHWSRQITCHPLDMRYSFELQNCLGFVNLNANAGTLPCGLVFRLLWSMTSVRLMREDRWVACSQQVSCRTISLDREGSVYQMQLQITYQW